MIPQPPPGQGPVDPRSAYGPVPTQSGAQQGVPQQQMGAAPMQQPSQAPGGYPGMFAPPPPGMMPQGPMYPPMMMPPPPSFGPQPPRRGGAGKTVAIVLLIMLLAISLLVNLLIFGSGSMGSGPTVRETVKEGDDDQKIAVVPIAGIIDSRMAQQVSDFLDQAEKDKAVKAVIIEIDSPGGTVTASDQIYARLAKFKQAKQVPVVVSMGSLATSGGYYAACATDYIFAQETTLTGNIGVLMPGFNFSKLMDKYGIEEATIVSDGAKYKNAGSSFRPMEEHERKHLQGIADSMFTRFKQVVVAGRGPQLQKLNLKIEQVADGRAFTASEAKANGLVDDIGYLSDVVAHVSKTAGVSNPHVFRYRNPPTFFDLLGADSSVPPAVRGNGGLTVNAVNLNVDRKLIDELMTPRVLYLWRGQ